MNAVATPVGGSIQGSYYDPRFQSAALKILPGEYRVDDRDVMLVTVLGSCVAACLYDPLRRIGGMNHFMLPDSRSDDANGSTRYGAYAMEMLINDLLKRGAARSRLQAKLFGGGAVLPGLKTTNIGEQNAAFALHYMAEENIPVLGQDLGDICPRRVHYFPASGRVMVKRLPVAERRNVAAIESSYQQQLIRAPAAGSVELF
ncbi:MAG: chemoreceptor glutamine deamidase CheD [Nevskiaceae bacterium]|nr:MAG: chemoreceptor glutamine deamidase CheD [Nevskiaceae bacterium]TBR73176.1 MAG: chemoreceptor glutamine deamidase CheD [Nevskiaceae bacterium]